MTDVSRGNIKSYATATWPIFRPSGRSGPPQEKFQTVGRGELIKKVNGNLNTKQTGRNLFHGNSSSMEGQAEETCLAADVTLVASGLGLGVEETDLVEYLNTKEINTVKVECITRNELLEEHKVRSKTMKVIVKAKDHAKAMNPDIWPIRVGVRYFRAESRKPEGPGGSRNFR